jgi:tetratricopeptide (TPR) repeat protein
VPGALARPAGTSETIDIAMSASSAPPADWTAAQAAFERGQYVAALEGMRALTREPGNDGGVIEALRLRAVAAFRLGELDEAASVAQRLIDVIGRAGPAEPARVDVLAVSVVAAGELARFEQSIEHVQMMLSAAARAGTLADYVRARGTAATCFALLGDPWAGQRLLSELAGMFQGGAPNPRLEATVRTNHASVSLQIARLARQGGDPMACEEALEHAAASLDRAREIAREIGDPRSQAFGDVHAAELALLRDQPDTALAMLEGAIARAEAALLWAHERQLRLLEAEALLLKGDVAAAREHLERVAARLNTGHEIGARIRYHAQMQRALVAVGDPLGALAQLEQARTLAQHRQYLQARAQSRFLRTRLELEHLHRYRAKADRGATPSQPGSLPRA